MDKDEAFRNEYLQFTEAARLVASSAKYQNEIMGGSGPGVARELRADIQDNFRILVNSHTDRFSKVELNDLSEFMKALESIPESVFRSGEDVNGSGMMHPCWDHLRELAGDILLKQNIKMAENIRVLGGDCTWLDKFA